LQGSVSVLGDDQEEEVIEKTIDLLPGEQFRAATTFEFRSSDETLDENGQLKVNSKKRSESRCSHKLHFKQTLTGIGPIDVSHVRSKVKTRASNVSNKR